MNNYQELMHSIKGMSDAGIDVSHAVIESLEGTPFSLKEHHSKFEYYDFFSLIKNIDETRVFVFFETGDFLIFNEDGEDFIRSEH